MTVKGKSNHASPRKRILIVDDHPMVRERLAEIIDRESDLWVVGTAEDRAEAVAAVWRERPDLVMVDLTLRNSNGQDLIRDLHVEHPELRLLVLSMHEESLYAERCLRAGAHGYINKQQATRDILSAIRCVLDGGVYVGEKVSQQILARLGQEPGRGARVSDALSERELEVFELTGEGLAIKQIAQRLGIEAKTVETYRGRIREKLGLSDAATLLQLAIRHYAEKGRGAGVL